MSEKWVKPTNRGRQLVALLQAESAYRAKLAKLAGIERCTSYWVDGETRCQLVHGHDRGPEPTQHRHKPAGATHAVVTW